MTTLPEQAALYAAERAPECGEHVVLQRAYMAGALAALTSKAPRDQMLAERVQFGLAVGTAAERANA